MHKQMYEMKKKYVDGRVINLMNAGVSHVTSVDLVAPRPNRFNAMYRSFRLLVVAFRFCVENR